MHTMNSVSFSITWKRRSRVVFNNMKYAGFLPVVNGLLGLSIFPYSLWVAGVPGCFIRPCRLANLPGSLPLPFPPIPAAYCHPTHSRLSACKLIFSGEKVCRIRPLFYRYMGGMPVHAAACGSGWRDTYTFSAGNHTCCKKQIHDYLCNWMTFTFTLRLIFTGHIHLTGILEPVPQRGSKLPDLCWYYLQHI